MLIIFTGKRDKEIGHTIATHFIVFTKYMYNWLVKMKIYLNQIVSRPTVCIELRKQWAESGMWEGSVGQPHKTGTLSDDIWRACAGVPHLCGPAPCSACWRSRQNRPQIFTVDKVFAAIHPLEKSEGFLTLHVQGYDYSHRCVRFAGMDHTGRFHCSCKYVFTKWRRNVLLFP